MKRIIENARQTILDKLGKFDEKHPYGVSFFISFFVMCYLIFSSPSLEIRDEDILPIDTLNFIDADQIILPKRKVPKEISLDPSSADPEKADVERSSGISDADEPVDLDFVASNVVPPRMIGRLLYRHPLEAQKENVNAVVHTEILIGSTGKVRSVTVLFVRLAKEVPAEMKKKLQIAFTKETIKMLMGRRYTTPLIDGKQVPLKFRKNFNFTLK